MRKRTWALVGVVATLALTGAVARGMAQRPPAPPNDAMRQASADLTQRNLPIDGPAPRPVAHPSTDRQRLIAAAFSLDGKPYQWGAKGPDEFDCSGFTKAAYAAVGVRLPDGSFNQARGELPFDQDAIEAGDLIFYRWFEEDGVKHVTMYVGDGWVIGTGSPGQPRRVTVYPLASDLVPDGRIITYRHLMLADER